VLEKITPCCSKERKRQLEKMLLALDQTPSDPAKLEEAREVKKMQIFHSHMAGEQLRSDVVIMVQKPGVYQLRLVVYPIIFRVLYIPGGAAFLPSNSSDLLMKVRQIE